LPTVFGSQRVQLHEQLLGMERVLLIPIFDGHNDMLQHLRPFDDASVRQFVEHGSAGHIDLGRARQGGFAGGFFAVFARSPDRKQSESDPDFRLTEDGYEVRLADPISQTFALQEALAQTAALFRLETIASDELEIVRSIAGIERCIDTRRTAAILHFEGADAIDPGLSTLEVFYRAGLRSLGIVWSRPNAFGHGVPFRFPASPDTGPGLTEEGVHLVRRCNELGVMIDVSHLNEQGFWDVVRTSKAPIVATHSAAHAICPSTRNLTVKQLAAIRDSDGLVGMNLEVSVVRPDGHDDPDTPLDVYMQQITYLIDRLGVARVAIGSDFDGATMPRAITDVAGLPALTAAMRKHGFDETTIEKISWRNWLRVLDLTWH